MKKRLRSYLGLIAGLVFAYLAVRSVSLEELLNGFKNADYRYLLPCLVLTLLGHALRALRWQFLMLSVRLVPFSRLFSALMIGYVVNSITPAHLGELVRAYVLGKREGMPASAVLASIVVERIVDVLSLLALMFLSAAKRQFRNFVLPIRPRSGQPSLASIMPTQAVSTSSATTRGLVSCQNARPSAIASPRLAAAVGIRL